MKTYIQTHWHTYLLLFCILFIGIFLRLYNTNWDQGFHLHPDERFLTMVGMAEQMPTSFFDYLNPLTSPLNPFAVGYSFFTYGTLPLTINVLLSLLLDTHSYDSFTLQGRVLSALFDIATLLVVYKTAQLLAKHFQYTKAFPLLATFFYAIAVLPIQLSHFFTVDMFVNFFSFFSFYFALQFSFTKKNRYVFLCSILFGLALASKVSAVLFFPLIALLFFVARIRSGVKYYLFSLYSLFAFLSIVLLFFVCTYITLRFANPYMFSSSNLFNPILNDQLLKSLLELYREYSPATFFPPAYQWLNKTPILFSLQNIALYGLGIPYALLSLLGISVFFKEKKLILVIIAAWVIGMVLLQGMQFAQTMRYFIFFYPFFALFAGLATAIFFRKFGKIFLILALLGSSIWTLLFFSIYIKPHSRIVASKWIDTMIPQGKTILTEYWDDALPLPLPENRKYTIINLPVFDLDSATKWQKMNALLQRGDYLILSSNRGWGTISTLPKKFPETSVWYTNLLGNKLSYKKIAEFHSYPTLSYLGIPFTFNDSPSEEAFTVYDHPTVLIFQHD